MNLEEQILSIVFSFLYGIIIHYLYRLFYNLLYNGKKYIRFFNNLLFVIDLIIMYFIFFLYINEGNIKIVFILITISTLLISNYLNLQKKCQKKNNAL